MHVVTLSRRTSQTNETNMVDMIKSRSHSRCGKTTPPPLIRQQWQRQIQRRRTGQPPFEILYRVFLKIFTQCNTHKRYSNQHEMFTICILFSTFTTKAWVMGHQNNLQASKIQPNRDHPPRFLNSWIRH